MEVSGKPGEAQTDREWLQRAVILSRRCLVTGTAYCVGAIIVSAAGDVLATGYSRDTDPHVHAEESALAKLATQRRRPDLTTATIYSSMEPCSNRRSRATSCAELILAARIRRVVYAMREPPLFTVCQGVALLRSGGVEVVEIAALAGQVRAVNAPILAGSRQP